jgi:O-antigen/teichoic acid export membrane protein
MITTEIPDTSTGTANAGVLEVSAAPEQELSLSSGFLKQELRRLALQSSHYLAGFVASLAVGFVSFPIFTRVLSVSEYGIMDLGQRFLLMLTIMSKLGLQNASLRFYNREEFAKNPTSAYRYYSTLYFGMLGTSVLIVLLVLIAYLAGMRTLIASPLASLTFLILGLVLLRSLAAVLLGFLRIEERTRAFNIVTVATRASTIAAVCGFLFLVSRSARSYFAGTFAVELIVGATLTSWLLRRGLLHLRSFDFSFFRLAVAFGAPLVLYEFAFAVLGSADRFLVRHYLGGDALGLYSVAYGLANNVNELLLTPLSLALIPMYMRIWTSDGAEKTSRFLTTALRLFIVAGVAVLAAMAANSHSLVVFLASAKYANANRLIPVILCGLLVYAGHIFVAAGLLIHKKTLQMSGLLVISAVLNIGLNCLLLPVMGLMGGAIATLLSYLACIASLAWASHRLLPLRLDMLSCLKYLFAAVLGWAVASRFSNDIPAVDLLIKSVIVFAVYFALLYFLDRRVRKVVGWAISWSQA